MIALVSLLFATFVSEDLACIAAGILIQRGELGAWAGVSACALGIFVGDVGLWTLGRVAGYTALKSRWMGRLHAQRHHDLRHWLQRRAGAAIVASRFLPGTRLPLYVMAGLLGLPVGVFAGWALVGALLWTPVVVLLTVRLGDEVTRAALFNGRGLPVSAAIAGSAFLLLQLVHAIGSRLRMPVRSRQAA